MNDLKFDPRQLLKNPRFSVVAMLALGLAPAFGQRPSSADSFVGTKPGSETTVGDIKVCWCPPGKFTMGSPRRELERRPGEDQVEVTLTKGFWMASTRRLKASGNGSWASCRARSRRSCPKGTTFPWATSTLLKRR